MAKKLIDVPKDTLAVMILGNGPARGASGFYITASGKFGKVPSNNPMATNIKAVANAIKTR